MVTDVILSGLTNLFALFGSRDCVDLEKSKYTLHNYFTRHFGIRNTDTFVTMYDELRSLYDGMDNDSKEDIIENVCSGLVDKIEATEREMMLLRLMQFCVHYELGYLADDEFFQKTAKAFGVDKHHFLVFCDFVGDTENDYVRCQEFEGICGHITTLWMPRHNLMLFTYNGCDDVTMDDVPVLPETFQTWQQSGVLKDTHSGKRLYFSTIYAPYANEKDGENVEFCGREINFRFPNSDNGMHNFSFNLHKGELVAVMGGSGTGKSTLMSLLNGTLKPQSGTITINGHAISEPGAKELIGFVPQDDLLVEELTVYQNLWYTAKLCFSDMDEKEMDRRVIDVLTQLGLDQTKDLKVGSPLQKTISGGQRKRLNIALELIREPAILFLDEPTSGLSSTDTEKVINILKELTYKGKLIIVNIHQPSSDVYKLFDRLWLLDKGGYPVFDGNPIDAITCFKTAANYADGETSTCTTCGHVNHEVILNIIEEKTLNEKGEISDTRKVSPQLWHQIFLDKMEENVKVAPEVSTLPATEQKRPTPLRQFFIYLRRNIRTKATNLQYLLITILEAPILALICALLTHYADQEGYTVMGNKNLVSYIFMAIVVATFIGMSGSAEEIIKDRILLKREKFLSLSYASYISSKIAFMAGVTLIQTLLFVIVGNGIQGLLFGFDGTSAHAFHFSMTLVWWGILFVSAFLAGLTGLMLSQCLNSVVAIYITIPILLIPQILLCGLVVSFSDLTPDSKTGNVPHIGNVIPSRWAYEALAVTQFTNNAFEAPLFKKHKVKYETQYYNAVYLYEIQKQIETMEDERKKNEDVKPEHLEVIKNCLPVITDVCSMKPYDGNYDYASLRAYTDEAESILDKLGNKATLEEDAIITQYILQNGKENYLQLKKENYNIQLENFCVNADTKHMSDIVDGHIVARAGYIYLTPRSHNGMAPFYSSEKIIGSWHIPTLYFNIGVMLIMSIIMTIMLYLDFPGRILRKEHS